MNYGDFEGYFDDMKVESELDHRWLGLVAFLLGSSFVLESFKPQGPHTRPFLSKPFNIKNIHHSIFKDILKMNINFDGFVIFTLRRI